MAAQAFAPHFLRLELPSSINGLVVRLIGCGGFHQECSQPCSPVAKWMEEVDLAFNDEGRQYGNLDEASAVAPVPRRCLVVWCGDHKQTPGGLRKTEEAKAFRRKLLRRPIALRGNIDYLQPHMLGSVVISDTYWWLAGEWYSDAACWRLIIRPDAHWCQSCHFEDAQPRGSGGFLWTVSCIGCPCTERNVLSWLITCAVLQVLLGSSGGPWSGPVVPGYRRSLTSPSLVFDILNWTPSKRIWSALATICLARKARMVVFYLFSGMRLLLTCVPPPILAVPWNGFRVASPFLLTQTGASLSCTIGTKWWARLETLNGSHNRKGQCFREVSRPVLEWRPKPKWDFSVVGVVSPSMICHQRNNMRSARKLMPVPLWHSRVLRSYVWSWGR